MVTILRSAVPIRDIDIDRVRRFSERARPIFNPDEKRLQAFLPKRSTLVKRIKSVLEKNRLMCGRSLGTVVLLRSLPNCRQQTWHTDYDPDTLRDVEKKPLGVILALQDQTFFQQYPTTKHILNRGDLLFFEGDLIHAGAAYEHENIRIHVYIDSNEVKRDFNKTYFMRPEKKKQR